MGVHFKGAGTGEATAGLLDCACVGADIRVNACVCTDVRVNACVCVLMFVSIRVCVGGVGVCACV